MNKRVYLLSLGCSKNLIDSENMLYLIEDSGMEIVENPEECEIAIVNTCGFIHDAKQESINAVLELAELKSQNIIKRIVMTGCLSQRYVDELLKEIPEIDGFIGTGRYKDIVDLINELDDQEKVNYVDDIFKYDEYPELKRKQTTPSHYAYLRIAEGCDNLCTYCIIPKIRGKYRSRSIESIVEEAKGLAEDGVSELIIIAEDTTIYGFDIYGEYRLVALLKELAGIDKIKRIRLMYAYPNNINDELIDLIAEEDKICNYLDMPIQHISDDVLKRMGRRISGGEIRSLIDRMKAKIPDINIRTSLIVGFPGESDEDFEELLDFVKEYKLERVGVFTYSKEEDTPAYRMEDQIEEELKLKRQEILMRAQYENVIEKNNSLLNQEIEVVIDGFEDIFVAARSQYEAPEVDPVILLKYQEGMQPGDFIKVKIIIVNDYDLIGEVVSEFTE